MVFIYTFYDCVLGEKKITTTTKKEPIPKEYTLQIVTPARSVFGLTLGGGFVKLSRLYDENGKLIHARYYSDALKEEVNAYKMNFKIPYFKLWKGFIYFSMFILIAAIVFGIKRKIDKKNETTATGHLVDELQQIKAGQLYGVSIYTNLKGENESLKEGWIKIDKIFGDTLFVQRAVKSRDVTGLFDMDNLALFKPQTADEWETMVEKINYNSLKNQLQQPDKSSFDLMYIGSDKERYSGVVFSIKGIEKN